MTEKIEIYANGELIGTSSFITITIKQPEIYSFVRPEPIVECWMNYVEFDRAKITIVFSNVHNVGTQGIPFRIETSQANVIDAWIHEASDIYDDGRRVVMEMVRLQAKRIECLVPWQDTNVPCPQCGRIDCGRQ
jgi:hypothetical protein